MMNWYVLHDLARERSRDMIDDATRSRRLRGREHGSLPSSEVVFLTGRPAHVINARVRAQARLRVTVAALDLR